ncbi:MAG TPA: hypothetical protein VGP76_03885 [Planctomycetaceae bacterium]|jgi:hypothetical protein|nr:hypothetical protein [Planctomycetaceae bacterium]
MTLPEAPLALASGRIVEQAARASNSGARTIKTWLHDQPAFARRVIDLRAEMTSRALGRLVDAMASAAETLGHLSRKGKSEMVRLSAARAVLELATKLRENTELEERLAVLEGRPEQRWIA